MTPSSALIPAGGATLWYFVPTSSTCAGFCSLSGRAQLEVAAIMAEALGNFRFAGAAAAATLFRMSVPGIETQIQQNNRSHYKQKEDMWLGFVNLCSVKMCCGFSTRLVADLYWVAEVPDPY
jgi:hypothetical protein